MFKNHIKIAFRFFKKNKLFSAINVLGLTIGVSAFILLTQYVSYEKSYDSYISNVDNLYRVTIASNLGNSGFQTSATNHPAVGGTMLQDFPEVERFTRVANKPIAFSGRIIFSYTNTHGEKIQSDSKNDPIYFADHAIINMFDIDLNQGDPSSALLEPNTMILSKTIAERFFGRDNPIGKIIKINDGFELKVTGVFNDPPQNTHLPLGMILSYATFGTTGDFENSWVWPEFYTYVSLREGTDPSAVEAKFPAFAQKYLGDIMNEHGFEAKFGLQPVRDIHLKSHLNKEISANNSEGTLHFLMIVAAFIIAIALINFINLSTAKSMERAKEVGLKKVVGANRKTLIWQFLFESLIINFFAIVLSIAIVCLCIPAFNNLIGFEILTLRMWSRWELWSILISIFIGGGILAGLYPAFVLSSFIPVNILRGSFQKIGKGLFLRKALVITQFAVSIALVVGTYIVYSQFSFMQNQDLGFDTNHNLVISTPTFADSTTTKKIETFKHELIQDPNIKSVTLSNEVPGNAVEWGNMVRQPHIRKEHAVSSDIICIDHDFFNTYAIPLLAGRNFRKQDATAYFGQEGNIVDGHNVIINKSAANLLGFERPEMAIDHDIIFKFGPVDRRARVLGVVQDYHQQSLQQGYSPMVFLYFDNYFFQDHITVNIAGNVFGTVNTIEAKYKEYFPNDLIDHFFVDEYFNRQYQADLKFGTICLLFSVLAIFIASLGLFGLGSHMVLQKTKEIGVRKVLGANILQALWLIPKRLLSLVLISGIIALPVIYFMVKKWLENYAFKIEMNLWMFLLPIVLVLIIALLSIVIQSFRAAHINPTISLKDE
ncbi:ABC transporter permease [Flavobacteriaceae bacterium GF1]